MMWLKLLVWATTLWPKKAELEKKASPFHK